MTYEEYENLVTILTTATDGKEGVAADLLAALKEDDAKRTADQTTIAELNNKVSKLNETNSKLFLSMTGNGGKSKEDEHEKTPREIFNELYDKKYYGDKK